MAKNKTKNLTVSSTGEYVEQLEHSNIDDENAK